MYNYELHIEYFFVTLYHSNSRQLDAFRYVKKVAASKGVFFMASVRNSFGAKFFPSDRLKEVIKYNQDLAISGRRNLYTADEK